MSKQILVDELHRQARKRFPRRRVIMKGINDTWQIDLVDMIAYEKENQGYKYLLTVIDTFSKYAYASPLKTKTGQEVADVMEKVFIENRKHPKNIHSDDGKEFFNKNFKEIMKKYKINHYSTFSGMKAQICERFNRTLKNKMWKKFSFNGTHEWISMIDDLIHEYNNTIHRTIKMMPSKVKKKHEKKLLKTVYNRLKVFKKGKFRVGDYVRISKSKAIFDKGYEPNWSTEIFKIVKIQITNPVTYLLQDYESNPISGGFYEFEIQKVSDPDAYLVEKVLKRKDDELYVKWLGFDSSHNSWIHKNNLL
jgi:Integrase core domain